MWAELLPPTTLTIRFPNLCDYKSFNLKYNVLYSYKSKIPLPIIQNIVSILRGIFIG